MRWHLRLAAALLLAAIVGVGSDAPARAQVPPDELEVILVMDTSASMRPTLDSAKAAAIEFVLAMPADVPIGLETFGDSVTLLTPPTVDRMLLDALIMAIVADGDTALYDAVVAASQHFTSTAETRVLVVLSDGKDEGSTATLDEAIGATVGEHVEAISLTTDLTDLDSLLALGTVTSADDASGMSAAFARVANLIAANVIAPTASPSTTVAEAVVTTPATVPTTVPATIARPVETMPAPAAVRDAEQSNSSPAALWFGGIAVFLGLFGVGMLLFPRERVSKARLGIEKPRNVSEMGVRTVSVVEAVLERHGKHDQLAASLATADISTKPAEFVATVAIAAIVAGFVGLALSGPMVGLLLACAICLGARFYVQRNKLKRQAAFADQLPDVLRLVTTALRSGYGITQALESVAEEAEETARAEFAHVLVETRLGRDLSDSLRSLAERMQSKDLGWMVSAIDINRETGGNLSEILETVSSTIRERGRLARQIRTLTAEGRTSARILTVFPLVMALWQWRANPENFELLTQGGGLVALFVAAALMLIGTIWVRHIVNSIAL